MEKFNVHSRITRPMIYCEMMTTVNLVDIHHHLIQIQEKEEKRKKKRKMEVFFPLVVKTFRISSLNSFQIQHTAALIMVTML